MFSLEKAQGDLTNVRKYPEGGYIEDGARLFSMVSSERSVPRGKMCTEGALQTAGNTGKSSLGHCELSLLRDTQKPSRYSFGQLGLGCPA